MTLIMRFAIKWFTVRGEDQPLSKATLI